MKMKMKTLLLPLVRLALNGCVVRAAVDLAATTVMTAGKVVVKGTGAVIDAVIPDRDKKKDRERIKAKTAVLFQTTVCIRVLIRLHRKRAVTLFRKI